MVAQLQEVCTEIAAAAAAVAVAVALAVPAAAREGSQGCHRRAPALAVAAARRAGPHLITMRCVLKTTLRT